MRRRLDQLSAAYGDGRDSPVERVLALAADISSRLKPDSFEDVNNWLYDENGLPR